MYSEEESLEYQVGRVLSIHKESIEVIAGGRALLCLQGCHARGVCSTADKGERLLTVSHFPSALKVVT